VAEVEEVCSLRPPNLKYTRVLDDFAELTLVCYVADHLDPGNAEQGHHHSL